MDGKIIKDKITMMTNSYSYLEGEVLTVCDDIVVVTGLNNTCLGELVFVTDRRYKGVVMGLDEDAVLISMLEALNLIIPGDTVISEGRILEVPVGYSLLGRVVNATGEPLDNLGPIDSDIFYPTESSAPSVMDRAPVNSSFSTGIKMIDALVPIGKGQRELIIGDRKTGKTQIALDAIIHQKDKNIKCVYVAIGKSTKEMTSISNTLKEHQCMNNTTIVFASASSPSAAQMIAPFTGCAIAEYFMHHGEDVLIVYDDLTKHAWAYRQISLLLGRSPGREAYPGDIFYLHARLLERAAYVNEAFVSRKTNNKVQNKKGSITALPILETQDGDISSFISTNVISITDGQIFLDAAIFNKNIRPALDVGNSISRVGKTAQVPLVRQVSGSARLLIAQYKELVSFSKIASELDESTKRTLAIGANTNEIFKQHSFEPVTRNELVITLLIIKENIFDNLPVKQIQAFELFARQDLKNRSPDVYERLGLDKALSGDEMATITTLLHNTKIRFEMTLSIG